MTDAFMKGQDDKHTAHLQLMYWHDDKGVANYRERMPLNTLSM